MSNISTANAAPRSILPALAFPVGFLAGIIGLVTYFRWGQGHLEGSGLFEQSPLLADLIVFVTDTLATDPFLILIGLGFFGFYAAVSSIARLKGHSAGHLLALFKSTGFSTSLALVAAKLPPILTGSFPAAAAIAPVYQTLGWITFAVAGACGLELIRETIWVFTHSADEE